MKINIMKKSFSRDLAIEVIAVSEDVMSFADAQKFAAEKGGRLPDQVEAMLIASESTSPDLLTNSIGYWCTFKPYYRFGSNGAGYFHEGTVSSFLYKEVADQERFWCHVMVVK